MNDRSYQLDFYETCERVRDPRSRLAVARKIHFVLNEVLKLDTSDFTCLDVGSASGTIATSLAPAFAQMAAMDIDTTALAARPDDPDTELDYLVADAMRLPLPDASFDFILCLQVYEHVPDDELLIREIYRVLRPGGYVYFSGPNKLFPIEPHYFLPFLHWLPQTWADFYLQLMGKGTHYYEKSRTYWGLKSLFREFRIHDVTGEIALLKVGEHLPGRIPALVKNLTRWIWPLIAPIFPNYNWVLRKSEWQESEYA